MDTMVKKGKRPGTFKRAVQKVFPTGYAEEFKGTIKLGWALVLTQVCEQYFQPIAVMFGGHLGKLELDAIALSNTLINVLGFSIVVGMASSCETVFSQSYGYGNYKMIGVYLQRSLYIHMMALLVCYALHLNIEPILLAIGQNPDVARLTGQYLLYFMPGICFLFLTTILRRYTQCQSIVIPHIFIMSTAHALHALLQYLFLYQFQLGILGSAVAQDITFFYILTVTLIYTLRSKAHKLAWGGWSRLSLLEWGPLARLAIFGLLMTCFEWWAFEISIIIAGMIGTTELGAQSVAFNLDSLCYGIPFGISIAASIRVGQYLGAGMPENAKTAARVGMTLTVGNGILWAIAYTALRFELPKIFTSEPDVLQLVAEISPIMALYTVGSAVNTLGRGVFRGIGWQLAGSVLSFISFYVIAWPIGLPLTLLTDLSILGLWWGLMIGISISGLIFFVVVNFKLNWEKLSDKAVALARAQPCAKVNADDESTEATALLGKRRTLSVSESLTMSAIKELSHSASHTKPPAAAGLLKEVRLSKPSAATELLEGEVRLSRALIVKRVVTVGFIVGIFLAGLITRLATQSSAGEPLTAATTMRGPPDVTMTTGAGSTTTNTTMIDLFHTTAGNNATLNIL